MHVSCQWTPSKHAHIIIIIIIVIIIIITTYYFSISIKWLKKREGKQLHLKILHWISCQRTNICIKRLLAWLNEVF